MAADACLVESIIPFGRKAGKEGAMAMKTYRMAGRAVSLFLLIMLFSATAQARTITVDDDGPADFNNIQAAIDDSDHGDIIEVHPGTYTGDGNRDIDFLGKAITVQSIDPNDLNIVAATIIDCNGTEEEPHRGFYFHNNEDTNSVIAGLTITNGYADAGAAVFCEAGGPTITNCIITLNTGRYVGAIYCGPPPEPPGPTPPPPPPPPPPPGMGGEQLIPTVFSDINLPGPVIADCTFSENNRGGVSLSGRNAKLLNCIFKENSVGVYIVGGNATFINCTFSENSVSGMGITASNATLINCTFDNNWSQEGGAIYSAYDSNTVLTNCVFTGNSTDYWGGAIYNEYQSKLTMTDCAFTGNSAGTGGGIYNIENSSATITNCTFNDNSSTQGGGIYNRESNLILTECKFKNNSSTQGGGIYCNNGTPTIRNCIFTGNSANQFGGGVYIYGEKFIPPPPQPPPPPPPPPPPGGFSLPAEQSSPEVLFDANVTGPTITNCTFAGNSANWGGGLVIEEPNSIVANCIFAENEALNSGGGMSNSADNTSLVYCTFWDNSALEGGGMSSISNKNMMLSWCVFTGNSAYKGGGMFNRFLKDAALLNCAFTGNRATGYGGAVYNFASTTWLANSTYSQNWAGNEGGGIWWDHLHPSSEPLPGSQPPLPTGPTPPPPVLGGVIGGNSVEETMASSGSDLGYILDPMITNCIFWENSDIGGKDMSAQIWVDPNKTPFIISYNCIQGWPDSLFPRGNMNANPAFVEPGYWVEPNDPNLLSDPNDPNTIWVDGDYHLLPISLCIDAGDPDYMAEPNETDLDGNPRVINERIDMGAYEYPGPRQTQLLYVDDDAIGANNGLSWDDAFNYLQDALSIAGRGDEILVAKGIYKPDQGGGITTGDRKAVFRLRNGVAVRGGYAGIGEHDPNERNVYEYTSVLSGDLFGNDCHLSDADELIYDPCRAENSYHVLNTSETDDTTILDGLTIIAGNDNRFYHDPWPGPGPSWVPIGQGGGIFNYAGSPMVKNCTFSNNSANLEGGAIYNSQSTSSLANCIFSRNSAQEHGGGIYNSKSNITLTSCMFIKNFSGSGGALCNQYESTIELFNCTLVGNFAQNGTPPFIWQDFEPESGDVQVSSSISNSILWDDINYFSSSTTITYSDVRGGWPGLGNINANPCFVDEANGDCRLLTGSPCIDAGDPDYMTEPNETDLDGKPRVINGRIDMGAYEYDGSAIQAEVDIDPNTLNLNSKGRWVTAFIRLPEEYNVADIDPNSVILEGQVKPKRFWLAEDEQIAIAKFDREQVQAILAVGEIELTVTGQLADGTSFKASDVIKVIDKGGKK